MSSIAQKPPLNRKKSLECTCETIMLSPRGIHKKYISRCDFYAERSFRKAIKNKSTPIVSVFDM